MVTSKEIDKDRLLILIGIGFCQPKFYIPSAWRKAKAVMDRLVSLDCGVIEHNFGRGKGKYIKSIEISNLELANIFLNKTK
jgi:hypothetical protein